MAPKMPPRFPEDSYLTFTERRFSTCALIFGPSGMFPAAGAVPSGPHPVQLPEIRPDQHLQMPASASCGTSSGTGMPPGAATNHRSSHLQRVRFFPLKIL
ncbi:hypothetical protein HPB50_013903 [Hyalomma asiaticum]|uniref:Uncharacterized protein n=1 Tax=Hyalomma asiaticum TaxID=266040 RepID=A0ACB7TKC5_HYAAI|nr:hypothetical protein HPB50_013903 [Hyalomma asiaticum]